MVRRDDEKGEKGGKGEKGDKASFQMVKGKGTDTSLSSQLAGKEYKDGVNEIIKTTAVRGSDFDQKAFTLLDFLEQHGRSREACTYLKQALEGVQRDRVGNWRGYLYTMLRGFDENAYNEMKATKSDSKQRKRIEKRDSKTSLMVDTDASQPAFPSKAQEPPRNGSSTSLLAGVPVVSLAMSVVTDSAVPKGLNHSASVFVPGQTWDWDRAGDASAAAPSASASARPGPPGTQPLPQMKYTAAEFVPGLPAWSGAPRPAERNKVFNQSAAEFVPGRPIYVPNTVRPTTPTAAVGAGRGGKAASKGDTGASQQGRGEGGNGARATAAGKVSAKLAAKPAVVKAAAKAAAVAAKAEDAKRSPSEASQMDPGLKVAVVAAEDATFAEPSKPPATSTREEALLPNLARGIGVAVVVVAAIAFFVRRRNRT